MNFLLKLKAGDYGLAKTYWLYGAMLYFLGLFAMLSVLFA